MMANDTKNTENLDTEISKQLNKRLSNDKYRLRQEIDKVRQELQNGIDSLGQRTYANEQTQSQIVEEIQELRRSIVNLQQEKEDLIRSSASAKEKSETEEQVYEVSLSCEAIAYWICVSLAIICFISFILIQVKKWML